jgi:hypothetical protein
MHRTLTHHLAVLVAAQALDADVGQHGAQRIKHRAIGITGHQGFNTVTFDLGVAPA